MKHTELFKVKAISEKKVNQETMWVGNFKLEFLYPKYFFFHPFLMLVVTLSNNKKHQSSHLNTDKFILYLAISSFTLSLKWSLLTCISKSLFVLLV